MSVANDFLHDKCFMFSMGIMATVIALTYTAKVGPTTYHAPDNIIDIVDDIADGVEPSKTLQENMADGIYKDADAINFDYIFDATMSDVIDYNIVREGADYIVIELLNKDNNIIYPLVGFDFVNDKEGKLLTYNLYRMQPLSRLDNEYDKRWN